MALGYPAVENFKSLRIIPFYRIAENTYNAKMKGCVGKGKSILGKVIEKRIYVSAFRVGLVLSRS